MMNAIEEIESLSCFRAMLKTDTEAFFKVMERLEAIEPDPIKISWAMMRLELKYDAYIEGGGVDIDFDFAGVLQKMVNRLKLGMSID